MTFNIFGLRIDMKKEVLLAVTICLVAVFGVLGYAIIRGNRDIIIETNSSNKNPAGNSSMKDYMTDLNEPLQEISEKNNDLADEIKVYVVGCVKNPGIVTLKKGQIINDAINEAGGATEDANIGNINLVYKLNGNVMLKIYSKSTDNVINANSEAGSGIGIVKDSGGAIVDGEIKEQNAKININTAGISELDTLPGIGEVTARDIISYREKYGPFNAIEDIMKVPRIKENRFNTIKEFITVE